MGVVGGLTVCRRNRKGGCLPIDECCHDSCVKLTVVGGFFLIAVKCYLVLTNVTTCFTRCLVSGIRGVGLISLNIRIVLKCITILMLFSILACVRCAIGCRGTGGDIGGCCRRLARLDGVCNHRSGGSSTEKIAKKCGG